MSALRAVTEVCAQRGELLAQLLDLLIDPAPSARPPPCWHRREAATRHAFRHGWFHSGDLGRFDEDGVLWFVDREKDVIKTGGENVASIEVERAIYDAAPEVAEVAAVGLPHAHWSEAITAFVVARPGRSIDPQQLLSTLRGRLDGFKVPKAVIVLDALPKTSTGKVQKNLLRAAHQAHYQGA